MSNYKINICGKIPIRYVGYRIQNITHGLKKLSNLLLILFSISS